MVVVARWGQFWGHNADTDQTEVYLPFRADGRSNLDWAALCYRWLRLASEGQS